MSFNHTTDSSSRRFSLTAGLLALAALLGVACDWNQFGNGPMNPHNSLYRGPATGISVQTDLLHPLGGLTHALEVGVTADKQGSMYVTSFDPYVSAYTPFGSLAGSYDLGVTGPRAAPFVASNYKTPKEVMIFTGAEGGGFHAIEVIKTTFFSYAMSLADSDMSFGPSESSPKRAGDGTFYIVDKTGEVRRYCFSGGVLILLGSYSLGERVVGAIALYDFEEQYADEEVLVATASGNFHVLDHTLTNVLWTNSDGLATNDLYYAGVTVAERGAMSPVAVLPIAHHGPGTASVNSGLVRAIDLQTQGTTWLITPSQSGKGGAYAVEGSVAILFEQTLTVDDPGGNPGGGIQIDDPAGGVIETGGVVVIGGDLSGTVIATPGTGVITTPGDITIETDPGTGSSTTTTTVPAYHATFASSDTYLYGIDLQTGLEIWHAQLLDSAWDAPVVDTDNIIYVGDAQSSLYAVEGKAPGYGTILWTDSSLGGGPDDIVKLGIHGKNGLIVGAGTSAHLFR